MGILTKWEVKVPPPQWASDPKHPSGEEKLEGKDKAGETETE